MRVSINLLINSKAYFQNFTDTIAELTVPNQAPSTTIAPLPPRAMAAIASVGAVATMFFMSPAMAPSIGVGR